MKLNGLQLYFYLGFRRRFIPAVVAIEKAKSHCSQCRQTITLYLRVNGYPDALVRSPFDV